MSSDDDLSSMVGDLARAVEELQREVEPEGRPPLRPPTPGELARFTSEVTIPAIVLALETNVRVLRLLQRTLRLATDTDTDTGSARPRERAQELGRTTLARLDDVLADLQDALAGRPADDSARQLLDEARQLRADIDDRLAPADGHEDGDRTESSVNVDVEAELESIKNDVDDGDEKS